MPSTDVWVLYRGAAVRLLASGVSGMMYASVTTEQSPAQRIPSAAIGLLIAARGWLAGPPPAAVRGGPAMPPRRW